MLSDSKFAFFLRAFRELIRYKRLVHCCEYKDSVLKLQDYCDIHHGERCFIIATGPSLTLSDIELLKNEKTISVNSCINLFDKTSWRPDYYFVSDVNVYNILKDKIEVAPLYNVFYEKYYCDYKNDNGVAFYQNMYFEFLALAGVAKRKFSLDVSDVLYGGASVVFVALQFAIYMGFKDIYLIGVDCNYSGKKTHSDIAGYKSAPVIHSNAEEAMIENFKTAKAYADSLGVNIYNATRGGKLEVFDRVNLDDIVG